MYWCGDTLYSPRNCLSKARTESPHAFATSSFAIDSA